VLFFPKLSVEAGEVMAQKSADMDQQNTWDLMTCARNDITTIPSNTARTVGNALKD